MLDRIMVALDGSRLAEQTLPFAAALARAFGAEIVLLRVVETPPGTAGRALDSFEWRMERTDAIAYLEGIERRLRAEGITVDLDVTAGRACEEILEMGRARDVDLLALGSHGVGGLSEFAMASTAHKVAFASEISLLVVPAQTSITEAAPFRSVLVPVDCKPHSDWALALSANVARAQGADLVILHVVQTPALLEPQGTDREREIVDELVTMNRNAATRYIDAVRQRLECPGMIVRARIDVAEDVPVALERLASAEPQPLLVLSTRGRSPLGDGSFGSLVSVMLANTAHPILVLREPRRKPRGTSRWGLATESGDPRRTPLTAG